MLNKMNKMIKSKTPSKARVTKFNFIINININININNMANDFKQLK